MLALCSALSPPASSQVSAANQPGQPAAAGASDAPARKQQRSSDGDILGTGVKQGFRVVNTETQVMVVSQYGTSGYQSQAGPARGPGNERALIIQPSGLVTVAQGPRIEHEVYVAADIVSAASANAIDAISSASAVNVASHLEVNTQALSSDDYTFHSTLGGQLEEPLRSIYFGLGLDRSVADDNASVGLSLTAVLDRMNYNLPNGRHHGGRQRSAFNVNLSFSQVLSPTTLFLFGYGYTHQRGTLHTTWSSVPIEGGVEGPAVRGAERFPEQRNRHAASFELAQFSPDTQSTLRLNYRYYLDDFDVTAHSAQLTYYQYLSRDLLARAHYRYHTQNAVSFWARSFPQTLVLDRVALGSSDAKAWTPTIFQTADSDLAAFEAYESGGLLEWLRRDGTSLYISYVYYTRTNGLRAQLVELSYAAAF